MSAGPGATSHGPLRVNPPATPTQTQMDAQLAASESPASIAQAERQSVPVPAVSEQFPALPGGDEADATGYALGFCRELLDISYRRQSRAELLEWAQYEEAPDSLPGVPAPIADKSLVGSLAYAGTSGAEPTPIPATARLEPRGNRGDGSAGVGPGRRGGARLDRVGGHRVGTGRSAHDHHHRDRHHHHERHRVSRPALGRSRWP